AVALALGALAVQLHAQEPGPATADTSRVRIYVPVEELDAVVDRDKQGVILSQEEFRRLQDLARQQEGQTAPANWPIVLSEAAYAGEIVGDQLVLTARLPFEQLKAGWQSLSLPFRNLAVESATVDGQPAQLGRSGPERALILFSSKAGRHTLELKLSTALASVGSDRVAALGLAPIASATLRVDLPAGQFLQVDEVALERSAATDQPARYEV